MPDQVCTWDHVSINNTKPSFVGFVLPRKKMELIASSLLQKWQIPLEILPRHPQVGLAVRIALLQVSHNNSSIGVDGHIDLATQAVGPVAIVWQYQVLNGV